MSATEKLRAMLDERGVEWGNVRNDGSESDYLTEWQFEDNQGKAIAIEWAVGSGLSVEIHRYHLTPAQAIEATLGRGACREVYLLMATDIGDGREEVLGVYATEEAAMAAINENQFGYALHHVHKCEVDE